MTDNIENDYDDSKTEDLEDDLTNTQLEAEDNLASDFDINANLPNDSDGDGFSDKVEYARRTNPHSTESYPGDPDLKIEEGDFNNDSDKDGWTDDIEKARGTDINDPDSHPRTSGDFLRYNN